MPSFHTLAEFLLIYVLFAIPALIYAVVKMVEGRKDKGKYLRCDHCGHSGRMPSILRNKEIRYGACILLLLAVLPGVVFISWGSRRYSCRHCGTVSRHLPSSESLASY